MTAVAYLSPSGVFAARDNNGNPLIGGLLNTYQAGTTTPIATFTDATALFQNPNPAVLNNRGEANVWLLPNVGYKYVLTDSTGNLIWTQDNIVVSQLVTLYGGVDTGIVNAYVLNFTANFTTLTDGIVIYWIPSHANTGPSTLNVNGIATSPLVNQDGSALGAGTLAANQVVTAMYKGGSWLLLNAGFATSNGSFTGTFVGFTTTVTGTVTWSRTGNMVTLVVPQVTGTSNSVNLYITGLPASLLPPTLGATGVIYQGFINAGSTTNAIMQFNAGFVQFLPVSGASASNWTNSGLKGTGTSTVINYALI